MSVLYVDVSQHDWSRRGGPVDWGQVAATGLSGVMCARASYGDPQGFSPTTSHFGSYMTAARAAGYTCRGGYHNLTRGDQASINRQVDYLRRELDQYGAEWGMADVEAYEELQANGLTPRWTDVQRFHDRWYAVEPDRVMAWYIARWVWQDHLGQPDLRGLRGPLIGARYAGGGGTPAQIYGAAGGDNGPGWTAFGDRVPDIWQYTASGTVPGASSGTDCNAFRGSRTQLLALFNASTDGDEPMANADALWLGGLINQANWKLDAMAQVAASQTASLAELARAIAAIGTSSPEVTEILAKVHDQLATQTAALSAVMVSTVAALGEGGATAVRETGA